MFFTNGKSAFNESVRIKLAAPLHSDCFQKCVYTQVRDKINFNIPVIKTAEVQGRLPDESLSLKSVSGRCGGGYSGYEVDMQCTYTRVIDHPVQPRDHTERSMSRILNGQMHGTCSWTCYSE